MDSFLGEHFEIKTAGQMGLLEDAPFRGTGKEEFRNTTYFAPVSSHGFHILMNKIARGSVALSPAPSTSWPQEGWHSDGCIYDFSVKHLYTRLFSKSCVCRGHVYM